MNGVRARAATARQRITPVRSRFVVTLCCRHAKTVWHTALAN